MVELKINIPENLKNLMKGEAAMKGLYFKDYLKKILEDRKR